MLFNSYIFIFFFLPITLVGFYIINKFRLIKLSIIWLTITSLFFYSYWNFVPTEGQSSTPQYFFLIILSLVFNHQMGAFITNCQPKSKQASILLWCGIAVNLALIGYYKYANFIFNSINEIFGTQITLLQIVLPLGISFYTFTQIAYLVDAYRGETKNNNYDLLTYTLFITFFPQLIAGPILRHDELIPQFRNLRKFIFSQRNFTIGLVWFCLGLSKKVLIADNISPWVGAIFKNTDSVNFIEAWFGALSYTFQLYFDFSGYSDMAIGLGLMFNIIIPLNFNSPYKATSIVDFWRRWHITLSNFLRDYLYIPLGGNRKGNVRRYINLMITMLLGGLWHGAGWTYVIWGGLHGLYLCINHGWAKLNLKMPKFVAWLMTFIAVIISWVLFRSASFSDAMEILKTMVGMNGITLPASPQGKLAFLSHLGFQLKTFADFNYLPVVNGSKLNSLMCIILLTFWVAYLPNTQEMIEKFRPNKWWAIFVGVITSLSLLSLNRVSEFLYFQF
ncbi:membrane-bound O-acyltransferase family protein [Aphanothece hegewaldii CCALA 016]|uniref:Membrane-bound O-acyltransferase family protein n=1 Tax=Aphanothece hegewaldii CCALA 016 TaxID=2107694 RepID=A0A2T1LZ98_9CHRO|nr:MBOAT family O-acyltransferase [Aphanothece hegewaldii]PSF37691.1 membrane-bound O-acyltransferase family protein [Aphanothece hegewaldii CCALA 016]